MENNTPHLYTEDQLMARLKFFIGICLSLTLFGIVFVVLYSLIFVTQPLNAISPIDSKFFELIIPIATFLTGTLSGIMLAGGDKDAQKQALTAANAGWTAPPAPKAPAPVAPMSGSFGSMPLGGNTASGFGATASFNTPSGFGMSGSFNAPAAAPTTPVFGGGFPAPVTMTASGKAIVPEMPQQEI